MTIKAICIGDPHFKTSNVVEVEEFIDKSIELVKETKPDFVVVLGDLLDSHEHYNERPLNLAVEWLWKLQELCEVYLIIGNHDLRNNKQFLTNTHAFNACKAFPQLTVCDNVVVRDVDDDGDPIRFVFVPYVYPGRFMEALESCGEAWEQSTCIFAHQEFRGCTLSGSHVSTIGDEWEAFNPMVISGHIHDAQTIAPKHDGTGYVYYTGASMQHAFGEADNKAVWVCEWGDEFSHKKIDLGLPKRIVHHVDLDKIDCDAYEGRDRHKLKVKATESEILMFKKTKKYTKLMKTKNVVLDFHVVRPEIAKRKTGDATRFSDIFRGLVAEEKDKDLMTIYEELIR